MASLERRRDRYRVAFRHAGRKYSHALGTDDPSEALALKARLEATRHDVETGRLTLNHAEGQFGFWWSAGDIDLLVTARTRANPTTT